QTLPEEERSLIQSSPQRQALLQLAAELQRFRTAIGLDLEEVRLARLLRQQGKRAGHAGESFEQLALQLTPRFILPALLRRGHTEEARQRLRVLRGVKLGAARTEFDQLVIRQSRHSGQPVEVLAAIEVKRNINDLAHGFRLRQENLAWLTGDAEYYDPELYRT